MRLIPVQITSSNIPVSAPLRTYISEKLGSVARSGSDVIGIAMALRRTPSEEREHYTASGLVFLAGRRIYCSASAPALIEAIDKLARELARLARERQRTVITAPADPVPSATVSDVLESIDSRVHQIFVPPSLPQPERAERSPSRASGSHRSDPRTHRIALPVACD